MSEPEGRGRSDGMAASDGMAQRCRGGEQASAAGA